MCETTFKKSSTYVCMCVLTCVCDKPQSQIDLNEPSRWQRVSLDIELGSDSGCAVASGCGADFDFGFGVCGTA